MQATAEPAKPSQDFLGETDRRHRVAAEGTPTKYPPMSEETVTRMKVITRMHAVVRHQQECDEAGEEREVGGDEDTCRRIAHVARRCPAASATSW